MNTYNCAGKQSVKRIAVVFLALFAFLFFPVDGNAGKKITIKKGKGTIPTEATKNIERSLRAAEEAAAKAVRKGSKPKTPSVKSQTPVVPRVSVPKVEVPNYSPQARRAVVQNFMDEPLRVKTYGYIADENAKIAAEIADRYEQMSARLEEAPGFVESIETDFFEGDIPYEKILSKKPPITLIGIGHDNPAELKEAAHLLDHLLRASDRPTVVAFERLWQPRGGNAPTLITTPEEFAAVKEGNPFDLSVVENLLDEGVPVVALEPRWELRDLLAQQLEQPDLGVNANALVEVSASYWGFEWRHEKWLETLQQVRQVPGYEEADIIVVAGAGHAGLNPYSFANWLEEESQSVLILSEHSFDSVSPALSALEDTEQVLGILKEDPFLKGAYYFKKTNEREPQNIDLYKQALGADAIVVVP